MLTSPSCHFEVKCHVFSPDFLGACLTEFQNHPRSRVPSDHVPEFFSWRETSQCDRLFTEPFPALTLALEANVGAKGEDSRLRSGETQSSSVSLASLGLPLGGQGSDYICSCPPTPHPVLLPLSTSLYFPSPSILSVPFGIVSFFASIFLDFYESVVQVGWLFWGREGRGGQELS